MKKTTILLLGNSTYANRGCEAIVRSTSYILNKVFNGEYKINSVYLGTDGTDQRHESDCNVQHVAIVPKKSSIISRLFFQLSSRRKLIPALPILQSKKFQNALEESDCVLMVGGDNYTMDYGDPTPFFALNDYIANKGKKYAIWGASIGPFSNNEFLERSAAQFLRRVPLIFSRESATSQYLKEINIDNVVDVADPAFLLPTEPVLLDDQLEQLLNSGCVGINISPLLSRYRSSFAQWIEDCTEIIEEIKKVAQLPILLIPHVYPHSFGIMGDDLLFLTEVMKRINENKISDIHLLEGSYSAGALKWIIGRLRIFAGARTHATIASLSSCVPTICFGYSMKAVGISNDVYQNKRWLVEKKDLNKEAIGSLFSQIMKEEIILRKHLEMRIPEIKGKSLYAGFILKKLIQK